MRLRGDDPLAVALRLIGEATRGRRVSAEAYVVSRRVRKIEVREGRCEETSDARTLTAACRVVRDGRMGLVATTVLTPAALRKTAKIAVEMSRRGDRDPFLALPPCEGDAVNVGQADPDLLAVDRESMERVAAALDRSARAAKGIVNTRGASFSVEEEACGIASSKGMGSWFSRARWSLGIMTVARDGKGMVSAWEGDDGTRFAEVDPERTGRRAAAYALAKKGGGRTPTGRFPAVLDPMAVMGLLDLLGTAASGEAVLRNRSFLKGWSGRRWASPMVTLVDDALLPGGYGSRPFDDEGVPSRRTAIVEGGVVTAFLHNARSAAEMGVRSTGNATRPNAFSAPGVGTTNVVLSAGTVQDPVGDLGSGVEITDLLGLHTANAVTGEVSVGIEGFLVSGGRRGSPIRGGAIGTTIPELFAHVIGIGRETRSLGGCTAPALLVADLAVSG